MTSRYFDVRKFEVSEAALSWIENKVGKLEERVGNYNSFSIDSNGKPDFPYAVLTERDKRELRAMENAATMARLGYTNLLWISGPGGDEKEPYPDTRITWLRVANVDEDKVFFDGNKAICSDIDEKRCVDLAYELEKRDGRMLGKPRDVDELREVVVGFKDDKVLERLAEVLVEMEEVWNGIDKGQDKKNLEKMLQVAEWVEQRFGPQMRNAKTEWDSIMVGAMIEQEMKIRFGINLMAGGAHGMSNSAAMAGMMGGGIFNQIFYQATPVSLESVDHRLEKCDKCQKYFIKKKGKCPKCS